MRLAAVKAWAIAVEAAVEAWAIAVEAPVFEWLEVQGECDERLWVPVLEPPVMVVEPLDPVLELQCECELWLWCVHVPEPLDEDPVLEPPVVVVEPLEPVLEPLVSLEPPVVVVEPPESVLEPLDEVSLEPPVVAVEPPESVLEPLDEVSLEPPVVVVEPLEPVLEPLDEVSLEPPVVVVVLPPVEPPVLSPGPQSTLNWLTVKEPAPCCASTPSSHPVTCSFELNQPWLTAYWRIGAKSMEPCVIGVPFSTESGITIKLPGPQKPGTASPEIPPRSKWCCVKPLMKAVI
jgi:hypothetical protein